MSRVRKIVLRPQFIVDVVKYVRAGCYPEVAAEAVGVPAAVLRDWLRQADDTKCPPKIIHLRDELRAAAAQARAAAEVTLFQDDRPAWLRLGPGKETPSRAGWSQPSKAIFREEETAADVSMQFLHLCGGMFEVLKRHPDAREELADFLRSQEVQVP